MGRNYKHPGCTPCCPQLPTEYTTFSGHIMWHKAFEGLLTKSKRPQGHEGVIYSCLISFISFYRNTCYHAIYNTILYNKYFNSSPCPQIFQCFTYYLHISRSLKLFRLAYLEKRDFYAIRCHNINTQTLLASEREAIYCRKRHHNTGGFYVETKWAVPLLTWGPLQYSSLPLAVISWTSPWSSEYWCEIQWLQLSSVFAFICSLYLNQDPQDTLEEFIFEKKFSPKDKATGESPG